LWRTGAIFSRKIDDESPDLIVKKPDLVDVLIVSPDLPHQPDKKARGYGTGKTGAPVAVTFAYGPGGASKPSRSLGRGYATSTYTQGGGGRVLHVMSHFGKQQLESDEFVLQNLILNFLLEANQRRFSK